MVIIMPTKLYDTIEQLAHDYNVTASNLAGQILARGLKENWKDAVLAQAKQERQDD